MSSSVTGTQRAIWVCTGIVCEGDISFQSPFKECCFSLIRTLPVWISLGGIGSLVLKPPAKLDVRSYWQYIFIAMFAQRNVSRKSIRTLRRVTYSG
ncbi:hypothetical protein XENTR_v10010887 [Xenopus tropicalis]|nr:hypothetical protein XENTR_v10010887 [Xenopus tropicalis]